MLPFSSPLRLETDDLKHTHPAHTFKNIPYSLALRLVRIVSEKSTLTNRFQELRTMLISRDYNINIVNAAIERASKLDRNEVLKKVIKLKTDRAVFAITYNPRLPSITKTVTKHWHTMTKNKHIKEIFPQPPMIAYKQPPNLKAMLCRAKLADITRPKRSATGMIRCTKSCNVCIYYNHTKEIKARTGEKFQMNGAFGCHTTGVIYLTICTKCKKQYVGQTGRTFYERIMEHLRCIKNETKVWGEHFQNSKCKSKDFLVQVIEKVTPNSETLRLQREKFWINQLDTKKPFGLNTIA